MYNVIGIMETVTVRVAATSANLGPAFDCLGLALSLWNEATFRFSGAELKVSIRGEGADELPRNGSNLILKAFFEVYKQAGEAPPASLRLECLNRIPLQSGLGSSAAAVLSGLLAANSQLGEPLSQVDLLEMGSKIEGHADNLAAALYGGLALVNNQRENLVIRKLECAPLKTVVVLPDVKISTEEARKVLPERVARSEAIFNLAQGMLLVEAFRSGEISLLAEAMQDRLHQPYRLRLIPGASEAIEAARQAGAAAALSGAGPSLIAFVEAGREKAITVSLRAPFAERGIATRHYLLESVSGGAEVSAAND